MATVARLAGAVLVADGARYFLVGNTKEPCDWAGAGFAAPAELDPLARPYIELAATREPAQLRGATLAIDLDGETLAARLAAKLLIRRNGSVSERLWNLACGADDEGPSPGTVQAQWLADVPEPVWDIVRDTVLRCV